MSTLDPDDDAVLAAMFEQLGDLESDATATDYTKLTNPEISEQFNEVRDRLVALDEMYADTGLTKGESTPEGRELHSKRAALLIEMSRRKMR